MDNLDALYDAAMAGDADAKAKLETEGDRLNECEQTILHIESIKGNTERVRFILREFAHKNLLVKLDDWDCTALILAADYGHTEVVEVLIDAARHLPPSADDNPFTSFQSFLRHADRDLETALYNAVTRGHVAAAKLLAEADPSGRHIQNKYGETPIYKAADEEYKDILKMICTTCRPPYNLDGPGGSTALHAAILNDKEDIEVVEVLIGAARLSSSSSSDKDDTHTCFQAFLTQADEDLNTALHIAVKEGKLATAKLLVEADPTATYIQNKDGDTPIYIAAERGYMDILKMICTTCTSALSNLDGPRGNTALHAAIKNLHRAKKVDRDVVGIIIAKYANTLKDEVVNKSEREIYEDLVGLFNKTDGDRWTILELAVEQNEVDVVKSILAQNPAYAGLLNRDIISLKPLIYRATDKNYTDIVKLLAQVYTDATGTRQVYFSMITTATERLCGDMAILIYAIKGRQKDTASELLDSNGERLVTFVDNLGWTALHHAAYYEFDSIIPILISKQKTFGHQFLYKDKVQIKIALDDVESNKSDIPESLVLPGKRQAKDVVFDERMRQDLEMYKETHAEVQWYADAVTGHAIAKVALDKKADTLNKEEETILHLESNRGDAERVRYIVEEFANKNLLGKLDRLKQTALHLAAHHGHTEVVKVLIEAARHLPSSSTNDDTHNPVGPFQAFIRQASRPTGNTALHVAVINGNVATVELLVNADPSNGHIQNCEYKNPIYIAAENGYIDIIKAICTSCAALSLEGPDGGTTAFHALLKNIRQVTEEERDVIGMMINAAKRWSAEDASHVSFEALCDRIDESGSTILQLAVERNYVDAVELILLEDPGRGSKKHDLMCLIYKAVDNELSKGIVKLLSEAYETGINSDHKGVVPLILAIKARDKGSVSRLLQKEKRLVSFAEKEGWTPLHYATYHNFDSILEDIKKLMIDCTSRGDNPFVYQANVSTPFHVAAENGYTSTLILLMAIWPPDSSAAYTATNKKKQNIIHLAAVRDDKEMVQAILEHCPQSKKPDIVNMRDDQGNTPLHILASKGCFVPELIKQKGLLTMIENEEKWTPRHMLYKDNDIIADQVQIKMALNGIQSNKSQKFWLKFWGNIHMEDTRHTWEVVTTYKRDIKDAKFKKLLMREKFDREKKELERYKNRTNTQIIVTALITTVAFTVGFTMPGGLRQSGGDDEGLAVLSFSKKKAFNACMVSDAIALLLSISSLFFYFLQSMSEDLHQVSILNTASTVLNIVSATAMMMTFITGTYVVLIHSRSLAITVSIIGSLFFLLIILFIIFLMMKVIYGCLGVKKNID